MVTSKGIRANPKKTKALADLQSPRTLKEMQSLNGKLASLNWFLAKSAERSPPFFNTLKNITKENKHEYRWTSVAEEAFQQMKKLILDIPLLTLPWPKETLYAYLAVGAEAVSAVLLTDRKGSQCPVHETSRKLGKYAVELGAYNINFVPRNAVKGQVLADLMEELYFQMPKVPLEKDDVESWTLFTDGASSLKGPGAGADVLDRTPTSSEVNISSIEVKWTQTGSETASTEATKLVKNSIIKYHIKRRQEIHIWLQVVLKRFKKQIPRTRPSKADVSKVSACFCLRFTHADHGSTWWSNPRTTGQQSMKIFKKESAKVYSCQMPLASGAQDYKTHMTSIMRHLGRSISGHGYLGAVTNRQEGGPSS
ncbi:reverse transcriptase domain-containing protein [Tanacetum coccineum]